MIALDLFCGSGGASKGLIDAGFEQVSGIDIAEQPYYFDKYNFVQANAFDFLKKCRETNALENIGFIWASPPCQAYSIGGTKESRKKYPRMIEPLRIALLKTGKPFVIENVLGAPLRRDLLLCGEMFGLRIIRHRVFEINGFECRQKPHRKHRRRVWDGSALGIWSGGKPGCWGNEKQRKYFVSVAGSGGDSGKYNCTLKAWQDAMQIPWVQSKKYLKECVPPKYSEYIGKEFLQNGIKTNIATGKKLRWDKEKKEH